MKTQQSKFSEIVQEDQRGLFSSDITSHKHPSYTEISSMTVQKNRCSKGHTDRIPSMQMGT